MRTPRFIEWCRGVRWGRQVRRNGDRLFVLHEHWYWCPSKGITLAWPKSCGRLPPPLELDDADKMDNHIAVYNAKKACWNIKPKTKAGRRGHEH